MQQGLLRGFDSERDLHHVRHPPRQNPAAVPVHDRYQIQNTLSHRDIVYVVAPDLIGLGDGQVPEKIRINLVCLARLAGVGLLVDRCKAHFPHQPGDTVTPNLVAQPLQMPLHLACALVRARHVSLIHQPHQRQAFRVFAQWLIVAERPADRQKLALPDNRQPRLFRLDHLPPPPDTHRPEAFAKKSRSTTSWPILA